MADERMAILRNLNLIGDWPPIQHVPILESRIRIFEQYPDVNSLLSYAHGPSLNAFVREGVVFKSWDARPISFKVINNRYLLAEK